MRQKHSSWTPATSVEFFNNKRNSKHRAVGSKPCLFLLQLNQMLKDTQDGWVFHALWEVQSSSVRRQRIWECGNTALPTFLWAQNKNLRNDNLGLSSNYEFNYLARYYFYIFIFFLNNLFGWHTRVKCSHAVPDYFDYTHSCLFQ